MVVSVDPTVLLGDEDAVYQSSREDSMHPAQQGRARAAHHLYAVIPRRMKQGATRALEMQGRPAESGMSKNLWQRSQADTDS